MRAVEIGLQETRYADVVALRRQSFKNYELNEAEKQKDAAGRNFALLAETGQIAASLRLQRSGREFTIEKLCSDNAAGVKGAGSMLVQDIIRLVKQECDDFQLSTFCFVKLHNFWQRNGFHPQGERQLVGEEEKVAYEYAAQ